MHTKLINLYGKIQPHPSGGFLFTPHCGVDIQPMIFQNPDRNHVETELASILGNIKVNVTLNQVAKTLEEKQQQQ